MAVAVPGADLATGTSVFGSRQFIEYIPGSLPIVIASPHGGSERPEDIPDRIHGVTDMDANTQELAKTLGKVILAETGQHAHLILCRLHRIKVDANRRLLDAVEGNADAEKAWHEHHGFIEQACQQSVAKHGFAFLIDLHGHGHPDPRVELGYLHDAIDLADCAEAHDESTYVQRSSLRWVVEQRGIRHSDLLYGSRSLGALLELAGFPCTPSQMKPVPSHPFFRGGYTLTRHCRAEENITGLQIEANRPRLRDTAENRLKFAIALTKSLRTYFKINLGFELAETQGSPAILPTFHISE